MVPGDNMKGIKVNSILNVGNKILRTSNSFRKNVSFVVSGTIIASKNSIRRSQAREITYKKQKKVLTKNIVEYLERQGKEDLLEDARKSGFEVKQSNKAAENLQKPLVALKKLFLAWAVKNLIPAIDRVKIFVKKIRVFTAALRSAVVSVGNVVKGLGKVAAAVLKNILTLDFNDSRGRFEQARLDLDNSIENTKSSIEETYNVWGRTEEELDLILEELDADKALTDIIGTTPLVTPTQPAVGKGSSSTSGVSSGRYSSLLDFIASGEGGYNSMNQGTMGNRIVGSTHDASSKLGKDLTDMTIGEIIKRQNYLMNKNNPQVSDYGIYAAGRYQIIPSTMTEILPKSGLTTGDKFTPENQDKLGVALITVKQPRVESYLSGSGSLEGAMDALANEFASIPDRKTGRSRYGNGNSSSHSVDEVRAALQQAKAGPSVEASPQQTSTGTSLSSVLTDNDFNTMSKSAPSPIIKTSGRGKRWGRHHAGIDFAPPAGHRGWYCALTTGGTVTFVGSLSGYGKTVIIKVGRVELLFAHLAKYGSGIKVGASYRSGQPIGEVGDTGVGTGIHLHFEARTPGGGSGTDVNPEPYVKYLIFGKLQQTTMAKATQTNLKPTSGDRSGDLAKLASNRTGGTKKVKEVVLVKQKDIVVT